MTRIRVDRLLSPRTWRPGISSGSSSQGARCVHGFSLGSVVLSKVLPERTSRRNQFLNLHESGTALLKTTESSPAQISEPVVKLRGQFDRSSFCARGSLRTISNHISQIRKYILNFLIVRPLSGKRTQSPVAIRRSEIGD